MQLPEATRQADCILPPRAGQVSAFSVSTTSASTDLRTIGNQTARADNAGNKRLGIARQYVRIFADGGTVYVLFGSTAPTVNPGATGANAAGVATPIYSGTYQDFWVAEGIDNFVAYATASGTATIRIAPASQQ